MRSVFLLVNSRRRRPARELKTMVRMSPWIPLSPNCSMILRKIALNNAKKTTLKYTKENMATFWTVLSFARFYYFFLCTVLACSSQGPLHATLVRSHYTKALSRRPRQQQSKREARSPDFELNPSSQTVMRSTFDEFVFTTRARRLSSRENKFVNCCFSQHEQANLF